MEPETFKLVAGTVALFGWIFLVFVCIPALARGRKEK